MDDLDDFKSHNIPRYFWPGRCCPLPYPLGHKIFGGGTVIAHGLLKRAADSGVELYMDGDALKVRGHRDAVKILSPELRAHKADIVALLSREAVNDPASTQPPAPTTPAKHTLMENVDTWRELDRAYQAHHFKCPTCKAAGLGYGLRCGAGAALWTAYSDAT